MSSSERPLAPLRSALVSAQQDLGSRWQLICNGLQQNLQEAQENFGRTVQQLGQHIAAQQRQRQGPLFRLASVTAPCQRPHPMFELAANTLDIKARLAGVPVYTVVNKDSSEFVLVSGAMDDEAKPRQLGLFFFKEGDAAAMVAKIQEESPELAKNSHVMRVTLDKVYDFAIPSRKNMPAEGVLFRFMPDAQQVRHALQLYKDSGIRGQSFTGVPVFQAEGLTVKTEKARYTPLFFSKEDLDAAVGNAYTQLEQHKEVTNKAHSARADADLAAAQTKYDSADNEEKEHAKEGLDRARARSDKFKGRIEEKSKTQPPKVEVDLPKVEVGCLEEVLVKMQHADGQGDWGSVMFVPAGAISTPVK